MAIFVTLWPYLAHAVAISGTFLYVHIWRIVAVFVRWLWPYLALPLCPYLALWPYLAWPYLAVAICGWYAKENAAIEEVKTALINQILQHTKAEIHDQLPWVYDGIPDNVIRQSLQQPDIPIQSIWVIVTGGRKIEKCHYNRKMSVYQEDDPKLSQ